MYSQFMMHGQKKHKLFYNNTWYSGVGVSPMTLSKVPGVDRSRSVRYGESFELLLSR